MASILPQVLGQARRAWDHLENPVMGREFRSRMRGSRSYVITGGYTLVVMLIVLTTYWLLSTSVGTGNLNQRAAETGRGIWMWGCIAQACLLPLLVPAFTCGAITLERERDLLELLLLTRQSPLQICLGKLGSGVGLGLILVLSSVPVLSLSLILGGVSPGEIACCLSVLVSSVVVTGALGLLVSAFAPKTVTATMICYVIVGFAMIGTPLLLVMLGAAYAASSTGGEFGIVALLAATLVIAFPPAMGLSVLFFAARSRRHPQPPDRSMRMLVAGLAWALLLLFLYMPGVTDLLLQGGALTVLHPVVAIFGVMDKGAAANPFMPFLWAICTVAYTGAAVWFFYVAVLRVRTLRSG